MIRPHKGINYDTGFEPYGPAHNSRKTFEIRLVTREMQIIADELGCTHIRITGADPGRIALAARCAVAAGLNVWFAPFPCNLSPDELLTYLADCAVKAEEIRQTAPATVFVAGCELSVFNNGFLPGGHLLERTRAFSDFGRWKEQMNERLKDFFARAIPLIRQHFKGAVTYASGEWEDIGWPLFDMIGVDLYRAKHNQAYYTQQLENYRSHGKPVVITEFGCCPVLGGAELGGNATFAILSFGADGLVVNEGWTYSEKEQVTYLQELYAAFTATGVSIAFWFTFADYGKPYSDDGRHNLAMASYGLVQVLAGAGTTYPELSWEPRKAFQVMRSL